MIYITGDTHGRFGRNVDFCEHNQTSCEYIPIESQIAKFQVRYYEAIARCHTNGNSNVFIEFMLEQIDLVLDEVISQIQRPDEIVTKYVKKLLDIMDFDVPYSAAEIMGMLELKSRETFRKHYLNPALKFGLVIRTIPEKPNSKNQRYIKK